MSAELQLTVKDFFMENAWQPQANKRKETTVIKSKDYLNLTVKEFLQYNNWIGKSLSISDEIDENIDPMMLLVKDFLPKIVWPGSVSHSNIDNQPKKQAEPEWNISDLSNLF